MASDSPIRVSKTEIGSKVEMSAKKPKDSDYYLSSINIEPAQNGVIINCNYRMKEKVRNSYRNQGIYDTYKDGPKTIFDDYDDASEFVLAELKKLDWEEAREEARGEHGAKTKAKAKKEEEEEE